MGVRIGIDVGGTFTKAVVVDGATAALLSKATTPTTHHAPEGVAAGVVEAFAAALAQAEVQPTDVELVVLSTTQAVNALLEGDVAPVGIVGLAPAAEQKDAIKRTRLDAVQLTPDRKLPVLHAFLTTESLSSDRARATIQDLAVRGAQAIAVSGAFSVEDPSAEMVVLEEARALGLPATAGHEMSGLYGLEVRTTTAAVNASILPHMAKTIGWVEQSIRRAGIEAPLMIMHGDLEVVPLTEARRRPATTILSGPAASVAGALLYHRVVDALFVEVGGTSTNIGAVKHGRPAVKYVRIMDHPTCLRSVDVRVAGVAGGSMIRLRGRKIVDVGPRSAHIAALPYPSFHDPAELTGLKLFTFAPRDGDPSDYVAVENASGRRFALTLTDAANALGLVPDSDHAHGNQESARLAFAPLAAFLGVTVEQAARRVLDLAEEKILPVLKDLAREYHLDKPTIVGLGGGASVLVPRAAELLRLPFEIVEHAEVISSIGVALAPVGIEMERGITNDVEAPARWVREAVEAAVQAGAERETVSVKIRHLPERAAVRISATGAHQGVSRGCWAEIDASMARSLAAEALGAAPERLTLLFENPYYRVFQSERVTGIGPLRKTRRSLAVVDRDGAVCVALNDGRWADKPSGDIQRAAGSTRGLLSSAPRVVLVTGPYLVEVPDTLTPASVAHSLDGSEPHEPLIVLAGQTG